MLENSNPAQVKGERNVFCPHYRSCLDHASKNHWEYWACQACRHSKTAEAVANDLLSPQNADLHYSLSPSLSRKVREVSI